MALTIAIEGVGVIANASSSTESIGTGPNTWNELGGGTDSWTTDTYLQGGECFAGAYSNKSGWQYYETSTAYDFTTSGNADGQYIWIWVNCPTIGLLQTKSSNGLSIRIGDSLTTYNDYLIAGSDDSNGWLGDWKCFVIDPAKTATSAGGGGADISNINFIGLWIDTAGLARGDNIFIDQLAIGTGLRITGTSTTGWSDVISYCTDFTNRAWGMFTEKEGVYFAQGTTYIGDTDMSGDCSFVDSGRIIQYAKSEYWTGSAWAESYPSTACGIVLEDDNVATTYTTTFTDGVIVGTDNGRSGSTIIGNDLFDVNINASGLANAGSDVNFYGTTFKSIYGSLSGEADADHAYLGCSFVDCSQFDPAGAPVIRNCVFAETADADAALLWNSSINIQNSKFIANTTGAGIEHPSTGSFTYTGLTFSGNTYDVLNSSGSGISISVSGAGAASSYEGSTVTFLSSVDLDIHVENEGGVDIPSAQVYIQKSAAGKQWNYTSHATNNTVGSTTFEVNEVVDTDLPQAGWLHAWDADTNTKQNYRYASWAVKTFTLYPEVTGTANAGGSGTILEWKTGGTGFSSQEIKEGDTIRNTTDVSWAVVDEIVDNDTIYTTTLQGGSDNTWQENDAYSLHTLAVLYNANDKVDIPLLNVQTDTSGDASGSYNWGAIGAVLPIKVRIRSNQGSPKYVPFNTSGSITGDGYSLTAVPTEDTVAE